jgi:hypothetical protein
MQEVFYSASYMVARYLQTKLAQYHKKKCYLISYNGMRQEIGDLGLPISEVNLFTFNIIILIQFEGTRLSILFCRLAVITNHIH